MDDTVELLSRRLRLRRLRPGDAAALCAYRSLPEVARYQSWDSYGPAEATALIAAQEHTPVGVPGTWIQLALTLVDTGKLIGDCGIHFPAGDDWQIELGITLSPSHGGRGLATEALARVIEHAFESLGKHRVWAVTDAENDAAARLFRRLGFRQEAHFVENVWFKGRWGSEFVFALRRQEWLERAGAGVAPAGGADSIADGADPD